MGANIVSVSVILREKLQFMYNFNILLLSCLFFRTTKTLKAGRNVKSLMEFAYCELLPKSVPSYPFSF